MSESRILGGWIEKIVNVPHHVVIQKASRLQWSWRQHCGGSILSKYWIITAAHCLDSDETYRILYGTDDLTNYSNTSSVASKYKHDKYKFFNISIDYDLALLKLKSPVVFSKYAKPIKLVKEYEVVEKNFQFAIIAGFGRTSPGSDSPSKLLKAINVRIVERETCFKDEKFHSLICGFWPGEWQGTCIGDSGGGLFAIRDNGEPVLIGVLRSGVGEVCDKRKTVTSYTRLNLSLHWIKNTMKTYT